MITAQDPFVKVNLLKTNATAKTDYVWGGGTEPSWEKSVTDGSNVLRLPWTKKLHRAYSFSEGSLELQNAESFPNSLLLEVMNSNIFIDDKLAFAVINFSKDRTAAWVEHPANGLPSKRHPALLADGAFMISLARPVEVSVGEGALSSRRQRGAGQLKVRIHFE